MRGGGRSGRRKRWSPVAAVPGEGEADPAGWLTANTRAETRHRPMMNNDRTYAAVQKIASLARQPHRMIVKG